jgi:hypothetical protein
LNVKIGVNYDKKWLIYCKGGFIGFWSFIKILISTLIGIKKKVIPIDKTKNNYFKNTNRKNISLI